MISEDNEFSPVNRYLRNPLRILNHKPLIDLKLEQGRKWSLVSFGNGVDKGKHQLVMNVLSLLASTAIEVPEAIREIAIINGCAGTNNDIELSLLQCYPTGLLEFHATDKCDLNCVECHYRSKVNVTIPFKNIEQIAKHLKPSAITITGGGEPTIYANKGKHFSDVVFELRRTLPAIKLGLINNNTFIPQGEWTNEIEWQRSSLDAGSAETYFIIKNKDAFDTVVKNISKLLRESSIPYVGVGFLFRKENAHEIYIFLRYWHRWLSTQTSNIQRRFNIQFRPISPDINDAPSLRHKKNFPDEMTIVTVKNQTELTRKEMAKDSSFAEFVRKVTNFNSSFGSITDNANLFIHDPVSFDNCYNALAHRVLRANGDEYPDFLLCNYPELKMGNTLQENGVESLLRIVLMEFFYFNKKGLFCSGERCRQGWVNLCIEKYNKGQIAEETFAEIPRSFFF